MNTPPAVNGHAVQQFLRAVPPSVALIERAATALAEARAETSVHAEPRLPEFTRQQQAVHDELSRALAAGRIGREIDAAEAKLESGVRPGVVLDELLQASRSASEV